jgi:hypothetical protein
MSEQIGRLEGELPLTSRPVADMRRDSEPFQAAPLQTLTGLARDTVFFTPALLVVGGFDRDPVAEYARVAAPDLSDYLLVLDFEQIVFPGMNRSRFVNAAGVDIVDYRRRLYGVPVEKWIPLREFLSQLTWYHDGSQFAGVSGWAEISIPDITATSIVSQLARVQVVYFAALTTSGTLAFRNHGTVAHAYDMPVPVVLPVDERATTAAKILLSPKGKS